MLCACGIAGAQETKLRTATLTDLFPAAEVASLARTLPADRQVKFRVREPTGAPATGVIVFVSPTDYGKLPDGWGAVLDDEHLMWVAAEGFGNRRLTAERMLVAIMGLRLAARLQPTDASRHYVAGLSGGGRVASQVIAHFPRLFAGAIFIVGADYSMPEDRTLREILASRRLVFITGFWDSNRREMKSVHSRFHEAGVTRLLLIDQPDIRHEYPTGFIFARALEFLDTP